MRQPLFSIVIPLYNKQDFILETLKSIKQQSVNDFEIIIVNDGSTDNSLNIATSFLEECSIRKTIINQENKGLSEARNTGIRKSNGKIITLLDADDIWLPDFLQTIRNLYESFPEIDFYGTDYFEYSTNGKCTSTKKNIPETLINTSFVVSDFFSKSIPQNILCQSCIAFKKSAFKTQFEFKSTLTYSEDIDFYINVFSSNQLAYHYKPLSKIRVNLSNQMTNIGIKNKTIVDLDDYEGLAVNNKNLKKYLDFNRYIFAYQYKKLNDLKNFKTQIKNIDWTNLNWKQKAILKSPVSVTKLISKIKTTLLSFNIKWNSY